MSDSPGKKQRIVVGLSGGVDSAVTAHLLKKQGHEVVGIFMKNWEDDDRPAGAGDDGAADAYCTSNADFVDAAAVADVLGIEIEHVNFAAQYKDRVFAEFLREYQAGRTPNPDILCNAEIKFKAFLDHAMQVGADCIATGHYARVHHNESTGLHQLLKGLDPAKDQSYFLHRLNQAQLAKTRFPIGELRKTDVRHIAEEIGLPNAKKKDSTGICFIGERPFREFLNRYIASAPGPIKSDTGRVVGVHVGLSFYTLGQRQGLGIGGVKMGAGKLGSDPRSAAKRNGAGSDPIFPASQSDADADAVTRKAAKNIHLPWFVARKEPATDTLWAVQGHDHPWLLSSELTAQDCSWVAGTSPAAGRLAAKTRYRQSDASCQLHAATARGCELSFDSPQWAVTPGQSAVLYDGEVCLGGGVIFSTAWVHATAA